MRRTYLSLLGKLINLSHLYLFPAGFPAEQLQKKEILPINRPTSKQQKERYYIWRQIGLKIKKFNPIWKETNMGLKIRSLSFLVFIFSASRPFTMIERFNDKLNDLLSRLTTEKSYLRPSVNPNYCNQIKHITFSVCC